MSGALAAAGGAAAANAVTYSITTGTGGSGIFGWQASTYGTLTPATLKGQNLLSIRSDSAGFDFAVIVNTAGLARGFFKQVVVELNSANQFVQFTSAAATFDNSVTTSWRWGNGLGVVWSSSAIVRKILIFV